MDFDDITVQFVHLTCRCGDYLRIGKTPWDEGPLWYGSDGDNWVLCGPYTHDTLEAAYQAELRGEG